MRPSVGHAVDLTAGRDNFRDKEDKIGSPVTRSLAYT